MSADEDTDGWVSLSLKEEARVGSSEAAESLTERRVVLIFRVLLGMLCLVHASFKLLCNLLLHMKHTRHYQQAPFFKNTLLLTLYF